MIDARVSKRLPSHSGGEPFDLNIHLRSDSAVTVLLGPSGSGKTLTLNCLAGFVRPDAGRILVQDELYFDAATHVHVPAQQRRCGYIFQDHALFPHMSVRENLDFAAQASRAPRTGRLEQRRRVNDLLETLEIGGLAERKPHQLSGGQKQRASIARSLIGNPRLLLLDEPTRGLDSRLRTGFYELLQQAKERLKVPMVLVTHDVDECFELADTVCFIEQGRFLQSGLKGQVMAKPATIEVARLLGLYVLAPAEISHLDPAKNVSRLRLGAQMLGSQELEGPYLPGHLLGDHGWVCVRRNELRVLPYPPKAAENQIVVAPRHTSHLADRVRIHFDEDLTADVSETNYVELRGSRELRVEIPKSAVHFLAK